MASYHLQLEGFTDLNQMVSLVLYFVFFEYLIFSPKHVIWSSQQQNEESETAITNSSGRLNKKDTGKPFELFNSYSWLMTEPHDF